MWHCLPRHAYGCRAHSCTRVQAVNKALQQKATLEMALTRAQDAAAAAAEEASRTAAEAAAQLAEAERVRDGFAKRLEETQEEFMKLEGEHDSLECAANARCTCTGAASGMPAWGEHVTASV
jgi:hypothetical protein